MDLSAFLDGDNPEEGLQTECGDVCRGGLCVSCLPPSCHILHHVVSHSTLNWFTSSSLPPRKSLCQGKWGGRGKKLGMGPKLSTMKTKQWYQTILVLNTAACQILCTEGYVFHEVLSAKTKAKRQEGRLASVEREVRAVVEIMLWLYQKDQRRSEKEKVSSIPIPFWNSVST